ncbi:NADP-specific glutamate dehydrogenase [bioreactor metagenome]|uniref:NADP-specific glutamate dehydrogenase n=1 Tax=bioreactor metagenome TaxID=1076179 RepID=A0A645FMX8_9ZZZZ
MVISGSGNVAIYAAEKVITNKGRVIAMSDSQGYIIDDDIDLDTIKLIKEVKRSSLSEYPELCGHGKYQNGSVYDDRSLRYDIALPCATQNEIDINRAKNIVSNGCFIVAEGANMPNDNEAIGYYLTNDVVFAPGKTANAGGVATSALEMTQNSMRYGWSFEEVDAKLHAIMVNIHRQCVDAIKQYHLNTYDYVKGANIAALNIVLKAMIEQGDY